jgi:hypothetical protein
MKAYKIILIFIFGSFIFSSCRWGLEDLPVNDQCDIIDFNFEKRELVKEERMIKDLDGNEIKYIVDRVEFTPDLKVDIDVNNDQNFITVYVKPIVDITNMVGYAVISPGAIIEPIEGAPILGTLGDFSSPRKYKVIAADGINSKIWIINVIQAEES